tara:strand:- start:197 stop:433 length:237 start_codon:yes stop_codon:yes gene_type:complete
MNNKAIFVSNRSSDILEQAAEMSVCFRCGDSIEDDDNYSCLAQIHTSKLDGILHTGGIVCATCGRSFIYWMKKYNKKK